MRHAVHQKQLPQSAQRFFTLFYHLNRPQTIHIPSCSRLLTSSHKTQLHTRHTVVNPSPTAARRTSPRSGRIRYGASRPSSGPTEAKLSTETRLRDEPVERQQTQVAYDALLERLTASVADAERAAAVARRTLERHQKAVPGGPPVTISEHSSQVSTELEAGEPKRVQTADDSSPLDANSDNVARSNSITKAEASESKASPVLKLEKVPLDRQMISIFRCMPHSVVVITACPPDYDHNAGDFTRLRYEAMTASSLTSVSMQGTPVISFNVKSPSRTLEAIRHWKTFRVHILRDDVSAAKIAHAFSTGDAQAAYNKISHDPELKCNVEAPAIPCRPDQRTCMAPKLIHESVVARLNCSLRDPEVVVSDHVVLFGDVKGITVPQAMIGSSWDEPMLKFDGLAYAQKAYGAPGRVTFDPSRPEVVRNDSEAVIGD